jgi:UDP-glucose:glycoprotein glucosyltransferase
LTAIIGIEELEGRLSDEKLHGALIQHATEASFVTGEQVPYVEFSLAVHRHAAQIQAYYQYFESVVSPELKGHENCDNVFYYNGNYRCDIDSVFALETLKPDSTSEIDLLPTDRVLGQAYDSPVGILYGDIESESFPSFHSHLVSSALAGKIQYVFRPKPSSASTRGKLNLSGYGVDLALKRTDYLVIDDRNEDKEKSSEFKAQDHYAAVNKTDLPGLGLKAAGYIMKNKEPFEALKKVSFDFPKHSKKLSDFPVDKNTRKNVQANHENGILAPGQNAVLVNGALAFPLEDNVFTMMEVIDRERKIVDNLASLVGDRAIASELINKNLVGENADRGASKYDYRTEGLVWLNDIEKDAPYKNFPSDVELFLEQKYKINCFQSDIMPIQW